MVAVIREQGWAQNLLAGGSGVLPSELVLKGRHGSEGTPGPKPPDLVGGMHQGRATGDAYARPSGVPGVLAGGSRALTLLPELSPNGAVIPAA